MPDRDDDIIEDYEEVFDSEKAERVDSAAGGPVGKQPNRAAPPPGKGKIKQETAKLIWIICIVVSILGVAAVAVDIIFDPLERRVAPPEPVAPQPRPKSQPRPVRELTEKQQQARSFGRAAYDHSRQVIASRAYDFLMVALRDAREAAELSLHEDNRSDEAMWIDAWMKWYHANYALELYKHKWPFDERLLPLASRYDDWPALETMSEAELESDELAQQFGAYVESLRVRRELDQLRNSMRSISRGESIQRANEEVKSARERFEAARQGEFDAEDLAYVNRPPRDPDVEPAPYME